MSTIQVWADGNEKDTTRMTNFGKVLMDDARFEWMGYKSLDVDLRFEFSELHESKPYSEDFGHYGVSDHAFNVELKECSDYLASAFGASGHLYDQVLKMRESGNPGMVLVLGGDAAVSAAVKESVYGRYHKPQESAWNITSMEERLIDFEANAAALGIPVVRWEARPWRRLLSTVHKVLHGGNLTGYRPRPANGERDLVAASLLFPGMGPTLLAPIMEEYSLMLVPKKDDSRPISTFPKIGKKRLEMLDKRVAMIYGMAKA